MNETALFQILEIKKDIQHAGSKATSDVSTIAKRNGFEIIPIVNSAPEISKINAIKRQINYIGEWDRAYKQIPNDSILLIQQPFTARQLNRTKNLIKSKMEKNVKVIVVVHDVEELRGVMYNDYFQKDFTLMLDLADVLIVHNDVMKEWFIKKGVDENKLVVLEIFDYLCDTSIIKEKRFERTINIAGNLQANKSPYIIQLGELKGVNVNLYGPNFDESMKQFENVKYHGSFPSNEIPGILNEGFGLVWDGESIESCVGDYGNYLRYNNPHKLSLYLASGLPVVIWEEAAEAKFVVNNDLGIAVNNLKDLNDIFAEIDENRYAEMLENVKIIQDKLIQGYYCDKALKEALKRLS